MKRTELPRTEQPPKKTNPYRQRSNGRYATGGIGLCVCGHSEHLAEFPYECMKCVDGTFLEPGEAPCTCEKFRKAKE